MSCGFILLEEVVLNNLQVYRPMCSCVFEYCNKYIVFRRNIPAALQIFNYVNLVRFGMNMLLINEFTDLPLGKSFKRSPFSVSDCV